MDAIVRAFVVRPVTKEQMERLEATFLEVPIEDDRSGQGGYAMEISEEYPRSQAQMTTEHDRYTEMIVTHSRTQGTRVGR